MFHSRCVTAPSRQKATSLTFRIRPILRRSTWIAKEAGIFKKHGLDLDTIFINGSVRGIQSLIAGDLGYSGAVGTAVINAKLAGGDVAIIQSQMNTLPYFIIGNANIKSPEMLKGRAAAVHIPGTSADFAMRLALSKVGIHYKDIKAITVGGAPARLAAVTQGQADFTVVTDGEKIQGEKLGLKVIIDMAKLNVPFQFNCSVTTRKKIRENPDEVRRVVWTMAESIHFFKTRKDESIKIMAEIHPRPAARYFGGRPHGQLRAARRRHLPDSRGFEADARGSNPDRPARSKIQSRGHGRAPLRRRDEEKRLRRQALRTEVARSKISYARLLTHPMT